MYLLACSADSVSLEIGHPSKPADTVLGLCEAGVWVLRLRFQPSCVRVTYLSDFFSFYWHTVSSYLYLNFISHC